MNTEKMTLFRNSIVRIRAFYYNVKENKEIKRNLLIANIIYFLICMYAKIENSPLTQSELKWFYIDRFAVWLMIAVVVIFLVGKGLSNSIYTYEFEQIGLKNKSGQYPQLLYEKTANNSLFLVFSSPGIPYDIWEEYILKIENALDITISDISTGLKDSEIIIKGTCGKYDWNKPIKWYRYLITEEDILLLGQSVGRNIHVNLNTYAHILIGGMTGSGKTILLKQLLLQCIVKDYQVYIADFKLGVDYTSTWKEKCHFLTTRESVIRNLQDITNELDRRLSLLADKGCKDINAYNPMVADRLSRIVFACDELAELLDTSGMDKEEKAQVKAIESHISKIARLGRAAGIHLILATQRPDADVLNGQIKSNMTYRLCGRANEVLSRIILDSTDASKLIPKDTQGVFINQDGIRIKGYNIQNDDLEKSLKFGAKKMVL